MEGEGKEGAREEDLWSQSRHPDVRVLPKARRQLK